MLKQILFHVAKAPFMGKLVGIAFRYFCWAIPVKKLYNSRDIIAFYHPKPSYKNHILIVPKAAIGNLQQLVSDDFREYFVKLWEVVRAVRTSHPEYQDFFVLVSNGGKRQKVGQVHFHMFTDQDVLNASWEIHKMIPLVSSGQITEEGCRRILQSMELLEAEFGIAQRGFSLVYQYDKSKSDVDGLCVIISGKKGETIK